MLALRYVALLLLMQLLPPRSALPCSAQHSRNRLYATKLHLVLQIS